jgi:hypothetical protein
MIIKILFGLLALVVLAFVLTGATLAALRPGLQPAQEADYRGKFTPEQYEGRHPLRVTLVVFAGVFSVLATIALLRGRRSAPALFFASTVVTMVIVEFLRPYVHPGAGEDYYERAIPLSAVVLVILFFTPVRRWYHPVSCLAEPGRSSEPALGD